MLPGKAGESPQTIAWVQVAPSITSIVNHTGFPNTHPTREQKHITILLNPKNSTELDVPTL